MKGVENHIWKSLNIKQISEIEEFSLLWMTQTFIDPRGSHQNGKTGKFGNLSQSGGGVSAKIKKSQLQIRNFENLGGGSQIFKKVWIS